jgi:transposase
MKKPMPIVKESLEELYTKLHKERKAAVKRRIHMLVLIKEGKCSTRKAVAKYLAVHRNTIRDWLNTYESDGLTALLEIKFPGAPSGQRSLSRNVLAALNERLEDTSGFGSYVELQTWLKETHDVSIKYKTLHRIVRYQLQAKPKIPRRSHEKKNDAEEAAFREEFPDKLKSLIEEHIHLVEIHNTRFLTQDESRLGLMPTTRRRITAKGVKPIQKVQFQFKSYYIYGAVDPLTGESFFLELPYLNGDCFQAFLNELSAFYIDDFMIMLTDNASAHTAKKLVMPDNIVLLPLPSYCPELNPIERLWQYIKSKIDFTLHKTLEALKQNVADILKEKCTDPVVASITGYSYIVDAVVALMHS